MNNVWAIVLAAGESKRMGVPKMLLDFNGVTMIEKLISSILDSGTGNIIVVLGSERESLLNVLSGYPVDTCYNANYKEGMLSSVKCGLSNLPANADVVFIFPGDQPLIEANTVNVMLEAFVSSGKGIVVPVYKGKRGHPLLIGKKYLDEIDSLNDKIGLRELILNHPMDTEHVETSDRGILKDFDTYEEYIDEINKYR